MREDDLLQKLQQFWGITPEIIVPNGDDTLVLKHDSDKLLLLTVDTGLENVHFTTKILSFREIGYRICAGALSDIAAMGGIPLTILVDLEVPPYLNENNIISIYQGIKELQENYHFSIGGGNIVKGSRLRLTITILGEVEKDYYLTRSGVKNGDYIYVTGDLGRTLMFLDSIYGLLEIDKKVLKILREKFAYPEPRINLMKELKQKYRINAAIDISDGLGLDLSRMAKMSGMDIFIEGESIPLHPEVKKLDFEKKLLLLKAIQSGEEYEVAFSSPDDISHPLVTKIGHAADGTGRIIMRLEGEDKEISQMGYDHLEELNK